MNIKKQLKKIDFLLPIMLGTYIVWLCFFEFNLKVYESYIFATLISLLSLMLARFRYISVKNGIKLLAWKNKDDFTNRVNGYKASVGKHHKVNILFTLCFIVITVGFATINDVFNWDLRIELILSLATLLSFLSFIIIYLCKCK